MVGEKNRPVLGGIMNWRIAMLTACCVAASGCTSLDVAAGRLSALATSTSSAENQNLKLSVDYDCRTQVFEAASDAVTIAVTKSSKFTADFQCKPFADEMQVAKHEAAVKAVVAYANALQQLVTLGATSPLDTSTKDLGTQLTAAAKTTPLASLGPGSDIVSAITEVADFVLKAESRGDARKAAAKMQPSLQKLVDILKAEHASLEQLNIRAKATRKGSADGLTGYASPTPLTAMIETWSIYDQAGLVPGSANSVQFAKAADLDHALDALLKCNAAIGSNSKHPEQACADINTLAIGQNPTTTSEKSK